MSTDGPAVAPAVPSHEPLSRGLAVRRGWVLAPLLIALGIIAILAFIVFRPFVLIAAVAASVGALLAPAHHRLTSIVGRRRSISAAILVVAAGLVLVVPVAGTFAILSSQAPKFIERVGPHLQPAQLEAWWKTTLASRLPSVDEWLTRHQDQTATLLSGALSELATATQALVRRIVGGLTEAVFEFSLFLLMLFFVVRDGSRLRAELHLVSPFTEAQEGLILDHLTRTVKGVLWAMIVVPIVQGLVATIGFMIFGVPSPVLWGVAVTIAATVPVLGSPLGWVPAVAYLVAYGTTGQWVGLLVYGVVLISGIDNVVKPLVLHGMAQIHPVLGFLAILGGLLAFGPFGFLVGPVVLSMVLSALRIYRSDVLRVSIASDSAAA